MVGTFLKSRRLSIVFPYPTAHPRPGMQHHTAYRLGTSLPDSSPIPPLQKSCALLPDKVDSSALTCTPHPEIRLTRIPRANPAPLSEIQSQGLLLNQHRTPITITTICRIDIRTSQHHSSWCI
jgi:hypothetical protein